jgi:SPP1 gp7 family putative phage head morphogenesis protein
MSRRTDPTGTATIQKEFGQAMRGLLGRVNSEARDKIVSEDMIGLRGRPRARGVKEANINRFVIWLRDAIAGERRGIFTKNANRWVKAGYERGLKDADAELRRNGFDTDGLRDTDTAIDTEPHRGVLKALYRRTFREWEGVVDATVKAGSRELSDAVDRGDSPSAAFRAVSDRMQKVGKYRASKVAQTEVVRAHSNATLERYRQAGVQAVGAQVEYRTAGDRSVCEECESVTGETYAIGDAFGLIPQHPGCRCRWLPVDGPPEATAATAVPSAAGATCGVEAVPVAGPFPGRG